MYLKYTTNTKKKHRCSSLHRNIMIQPLFTFLACLFILQSSYAASPTPPSNITRQVAEITLQHDHRDDLNSLYPRELESFFPINNYEDDIMDLDADADDDNYQKKEMVMTSTILEDNSNMTMPMNASMNVTIHVHPWGNYTKCRWYTLSHYISPQSTIYDAIEGFLIALLTCLIIATIYNFLYSCCLIRYGCCPDDRVKKSLLSKRGRRRKRRVKGSGSGSKCCGCFSFGAWGRRNDDGKGSFMPLSNGASDDDSDNSSVSLDSALSLEYGDDHLHNEFGEITSRWDDTKIEDAAREYFLKEDQESEEKLNRKDRKKRGGVSFKSAKRRSVKSIRSGRSSTNKGKGRSRGASTTKSQASSILSSSSENSFVSFASSSSGSHDAQEMESAMMDLELVKRSIAEKGYV